MPKMKSQSSAKKRFRLTASGRVVAKCARRKHNLRKRSQKMKRQARAGFILSPEDARCVKRHFIPYGRR